MSKIKKSEEGKLQDFIMLPTVDFCFKELMRNSKVRKGLIAAVLEIDPEENRSIFYLSKMYIDQIESGQDYGVIKKCMHISIMDYIQFPEDHKWHRKIALCDVEDGKIYTDLMELHVFELRKLPAESEKESNIMEWMRFLGGKKKEDFKKMEAKNPYIGEAYSELLKMSADERKRLEYEAREKAIRDKNAMLHYAKRTGREEGEKIGQERGQEMKLLEQIKKKMEKKKSVSQIADELEDTEENVLEIMKKHELI